MRRHAASAEAEAAWLLGVGVQDPCCILSMSSKIVDQDVNCLQHRLRSGG